MAIGVPVMILRGTADESVLVTEARRLYDRCARAEHHDRGRGCGQFGRLGGRGKGYGDNAEVESARRVDELAEAGDYDGEAVWRRIIDAVGQLANTTPPGPVH